MREAVILLALSSCCIVQQIGADNLYDAVLGDGQSPEDNLMGLPLKVRRAGGSGFVGMRGRREDPMIHPFYIDQDAHDDFMQEVSKKAAFTGMRGKKASFTGMRGKKSLGDDREEIEEIHQLNSQIPNSHDSWWRRFLSEKRARSSGSGFVGMRG